MGFSAITYNGYKFNDRSTYKMREVYSYDDSERTVKAIRFTLTVNTIICGESPVTYGQAPDQSIEYPAKDIVHNARQLLSKPGGLLDIKHDGLGPHWEVNGYSVRDISWGPKPRFMRWDPIGHTNAVEVEWECDFEIAVCDGTRPPALNGIAQFNYSVSFSIDSKGYTTRRITGIVEIAMTRATQMSTWLPQSVDQWKEQIVFGKPTNFERATEWNINADKRIATFIIVDSEIQSPNAWAPGVVNIQATHRVTRAKNPLNKVAQVLSATIELSPIEPKVRTWLIFLDLFLKRKAYHESQGSVNPIYIESIDIAEEIYANKASFQITYYYLQTANEIDLFSLTGLFQPLLQGNDPWMNWANSLAPLTPHIGMGGDRAAALLRHEFGNERIIDLCRQDRFGYTAGTSPGSFPQNPLTDGGLGQQPAPPPYTSKSVLSNAKPTAAQSWLVFQTTITVKDQPNVTTSVQLAPNVSQHKQFNPNIPDADFPVESQQIKRFIEDKAGAQTLIIRGYAERVGYPVAKPSGRIKIGGQVYVPIGKTEFHMQFNGMYFGVPKYSAAWSQEYKLKTWPDNNTDPQDAQEEVE